MRGAEPVRPGFERFTGLSRHDCRRSVYSEPCSDREESNGQRDRGVGVLALGVYWSGHTLDFGVLALQHVLSHSPESGARYSEEWRMSCQTPL